MKNGTARYILMQILYRILVLRERAIHFPSTRNSTSPTATCLSRDVCIVQLKDIQEYAKGARRYFGELSLLPVARTPLFFKYACERRVMEMRDMNHLSRQPEIQRTKIKMSSFEASSSRDVEGRGGKGVKVEMRHANTCN